MGMYANVDAARAFERALLASRHLRGVAKPEIAEVSESLGDVHYRLGEFGRADKAFSAARTLVPPRSADAGRLALKQANQSTRLGRYPQAMNRISRALKQL